MFETWFKEDIEKILNKRNRVVVITDTNNQKFIKELVPKKYTVFSSASSIDELEIKYQVEKEHADTNVIIFSQNSRNEMTFIREYCETCGTVDISNFANYVRNKVLDTVGKNINLTDEEIVSASRMSDGKSKEYWEELCQKGSDRIFDIGAEILPFLHNPVEYCNEKDDEVNRQFFKKINAWLGRDYIEQPPVILAKEVAGKILGSLLSKETEEKYFAVYKQWIDSKSYESSLKNYCEEDKGLYESTDVWDVNSNHPFEHIDTTWLRNIADNIRDREYCNQKKPFIKERIKSYVGSQWCNGLWNEIKSLL